MEVSFNISELIKLHSIWLIHGDMFQNIKRKDENQIQ